MSDKEWTHKALCDVAVKWLKRPHSRGGHGCHVAVSEVASGWSGEIPDAIGFRSSGYRDGSVVVEVKVSRSDFLNDMKKPHRNGEKLGMGTWRYYLCPEGLISKDELPEKWGLLYLTPRGGVKPIAGPAADADYARFSESLDIYRHERDMVREQWILVKLFNRIGDEEKLQNSLKVARGEAARLASKVNSLNERLRKNSIELWKLKSSKESA